MQITKINRTGATAAKISAPDDYEVSYLAEKYSVSTAPVRDYHSTGRIKT